MTTIKSYTDVEQSKKLAEILSLESADHTRLGKNNDNVLTRPYLESCLFELDKLVGKENLFPCWSLAALLGVLPKIGSEEPTLQKIYYASDPTERYICMYTIDNVSGEYNNPVDACYEMIIKLNELKML